MPRKARILVPERPHHVVQRGHNRSALFIEEADYLFYLDNLLTFKQALNIRVYAWCLMTNHIHLLIEPMDSPDDVSILMKRVNGRYSRYVNRVEKRSGSLWEGRFKASPVQRDTYMLACLRYIELNPVKANMVASAEDYLWSSFGVRMFDLPNELLDLDDAFLGLADDLQQQRICYKKFIKEGISDAEQSFLTHAYRRNQLSGNSSFIDGVEKRIGVRIEHRSRGRPALHS